MLGTDSYGPVSVQEVSRCGPDQRSRNIARLLFRSSGDKSPDVTERLEFDRPKLRFLSS